MGRGSAKLAAALGSIALVLVLTSCSVPQFVWSYLGSGSDFRIAMCSDYSVTSVEIDLGNFKEDAPRQSIVWSGPRVDAVEGAILGSDHLPVGWVESAPLLLENDDWEYADYSAYDGDEYVSGNTIHREDMESGEWRLSPEPGLFVGDPDCRAPFDAELVPSDSE